MDLNGWSLLRNPVRLRILEFASEPRTANEIADHVGLKVTAVYHHLRKLQMAGLVEVADNRKIGASVTRLYLRTLDSFQVDGDVGTVGEMLADALEDAKNSTEERVRKAGRTIGYVSEAHASAFLESLSALIQEFESEGEPGALTGFTYVLAPVSTGTHYRVRDADASDIDVIRRVLVEAVTWDIEDRSKIPPVEEAVEHPELIRYHSGWGRPGDRAVVVELGPDTVGGVFCRLFTETDHGHGFVDEQTPELAIAVWADHRGRGLGGRLLNALEKRVQSTGIERVSLSVDRENPARRLYTRHGYEKVFEDADGVVMVKTFER